MSLFIPIWGIITGVGIVAVFLNQKIVGAIVVFAGLVYGGFISLWYKNKVIIPIDFLEDWHEFN